MSTAHFAHLIALPVVIDAPGFYVTRGGEIVEIYQASPKHDFRCRGKYAQGFVDGWHKSGRLYFSLHSTNDIVRKA